MNKINILDVPKYYKGLPHQDQALNYLWDNTNPEIQKNFIKKWRTPQRDPRIDALIRSVPNDRREDSKTAIPLLLKWCDHYNVNNPNHIGYIIGTVSGESAFRPQQERRANPRIEPILYERQNRYWHTGYFGRGYIQITWRDNYERLGRRIGIGDRLVTNPSLALDPDIASHITIVGMVEGLFCVDTRFPQPRPRARLSLYDLPDGSFDFLNARRIVNLMDKAETFASYGRWYANVLKSL